MISQCLWTLYHTWGRKQDSQDVMPVVNITHRFKRNLTSWVHIDLGMHQNFTSCVISSKAMTVKHNTRSAFPALWLSSGQNLELQVNQYFLKASNGGTCCATLFQSSEHSPLCFSLSCCSCRDFSPVTFGETGSCEKEKMLPTCDPLTWLSWYLWYKSLLLRLFSLLFFVFF